VSSVLDVDIMKDELIIVMFTVASTISRVWETMKRMKNGFPQIIKTTE